MSIYSIARYYLTCDRCQTQSWFGGKSVDEVRKTSKYFGWFSLPVRHNKYGLHDVEDLCDKCGNQK